MEYVSGAIPDSNCDLFIYVKKMLTMNKQNILTDPFMGSIIIQMINNCNFRSPIHFMMSSILNKLSYILILIIK